jgi:dCTP deaminase
MFQTAAGTRRQDDDVIVHWFGWPRWSGEAELRRLLVGIFAPKISAGGLTMGILCDTQIRELIDIEPFEENIKRPGKISYGVSSYGYDLRVGSVFKIFTNVNSEIVDPKKFSERSFVTVDTDETRADHVLIPPNSFALCETVEIVSMPRAYLAICVGKSTYARCGIIVNVTPIEPEWRGKITLEISNTTPLPAKIYANEGIAQLLFLKGERVCATSYADKRGKYQDQVGLTLPKVD